MSTITFFPVDCGDMTLIRLSDQAASSILIDVNIRASADDLDDSSVRDVASDLRTRLQRDALGRPYVDVFMLSHPDEDHCLGLSRHFSWGRLRTTPTTRSPTRISASSSGKSGRLRSSSVVVQRTMFSATMPWHSTARQSVG